MNTTPKARASLRSHADSAMATPLGGDVELGYMGKRNDDVEESEDVPMINGTIKEHPRRSTRTQVIDILCILLNIASTVTLVFLNKW